MWGQIKVNCQALVKIDSVFEKFTVRMPCTLIQDHQSINRTTLKDAFEMIDKCIEPEGDQARIRPGICTELDQLRCQYEQLDEEMQEQVQRHLAPFLLKLSRSGDANMDCLKRAKFKMTMIPSMGFFIVMPKSGV